MNSTIIHTFSYTEISPTPQGPAWPARLASALQPFPHLSTLIQHIEDVQIIEEQGYLQYAKKRTSDMDGIL